MAARNRQKLIVIDDDQSSLDLAHQISRICTDLHVLGVDNIGEAACYLKLNNYDCALVGSRLVGTNGLDLIRKLMGGGDLDVPVVALLDADDGRAAAKALADGADGCLPKAAMTADALIAAVARAIERKSHTGRRSIKVLMAVDDTSQRLALRRCFERTGLDVRLQEATDAEACARLLDECSFDCMLLGNDVGGTSIDSRSVPADFG